MGCKTPCSSMSSASSSSSASGNSVRGLPCGLHPADESPPAWLGLRQRYSSIRATKSPRHWVGSPDATQHRRHDRRVRFRLRDRSDRVGRSSICATACAWPIVALRLGVEQSPLNQPTSPATSQDVRRCPLWFGSTRHVYASFQSRKRGVWVVVSATSARALLTACGAALLVAWVLPTRPCWRSQSIRRRRHATSRPCRAAPRVPR